MDNPKLPLPPPERTYQSPDPDCPSCSGKGSTDSGGNWPWDSPIEVRCECTYPKPARGPMNFEERENKIRLAAMEDALAGRKNSCKPRFVDKQAVWQDRGEGVLQCSYCGSLHPDDAVKLLKTDGTHYSGADHKYGWPHKFYIGNFKFYNKHIADANAKTFEEFAVLSKELFGISWEKNDGGIYWSCPRTSSFYGYQRWGAVGQATCPKCGCVGGKGVGFCFCSADPKCHPDPAIDGKKEQE